jgi:hypothetical protein
MDLNYLAKLPGSRAVRSLMVAGNSGPDGGVLLKCLLPNGSTETLFLGEAAALSLAKGLDQSRMLGVLPDLSRLANDDLVARVPMIEPHDWNQHHEPGRRVGDVHMLVLPGGHHAIEFVTLDDGRRQFRLSPAVARFLADYLEEYRSTPNGRRG